MDIDVQHAGQILFDSGIFCIRMGDNGQFHISAILPEILKDLKGAIEIHHAVDDPVVSIEYSRNLMKLLDVTTVPYQLYEYPTGDYHY